ncbi:methyltransferase domain-containing protein [Enterococcus termitis]|uniref:Methyltransferase n=1 Tax=Enterococcus termitis TaxID=332950 RepID=A0A1E5GKF7_9ENTE|nr:methyltransferase domain-containing protein [Enterococcus termitis]OEG13121.1 methyltransferase [Enterococcus termitis]OJG99020.1 hypothetical protein RV18_GL002174 [Enterococcus termitis]
MEWDAQTYNTTHDFIFKYGEGLLQLLPKAPKKVLDIGSGTGELTKQIAQLGHNVTGIDQSRTMIEQAKQSFPELTFIQGDILAPVKEKGTYEVVFSNAVFHWISDQDRLLQHIHQLLIAGGELICEFGAVGNVQKIREAFREELASYDIVLEEPFCFTSAEDYRSLLEKNKFKIVEILEYERPTPLKEGTAGLRQWMEQFYPSELGQLTKEQKENVLNNLDNKLKPLLWNEDHWEADYRRLRIHAVKR